MEADDSKKPKSGHLVVTSDISKPSSVPLCHLRLLYSLWLLLACVLGAAIWLGHTQIHRLRQELHHEFRTQGRGGFVEFNPEMRDVAYSTLASTLEEEEVEEDADDEEVGEELGEESAEKEQFLRVKRRARRHGGHQGDGRKIPQKEEQPVYLHQKEGSGLPEDWVWLTSYSRIPVFALQEFCSAAQGECPAGPPGPQGLPGMRGLHGEAGVKGEAGAQGLQGPAGHNGTRGEKGDRGDTGMMGPQGNKGDKGDVGETGEMGEKGERGDQGHKGHKGNSGFPGLTGSKGDPGEPGEKGDVGEQGRTGLPGLTGDKGDMGEQGFNGTDGLPASKLPEGGQNDSPLGTAGLCGPCPAGPPGIPGLPGRHGPPGPTGPRGFNGTEGARGRRGKKGIPGDPGVQGFPGQRGPTGPKGAAGVLTETNCTCQQGPKGEKGNRGTIGFLGYRGFKGEAGPPGPPGPYNEGEPGPPGPPGPVGLQGSKGAKGDRGEPGLKRNLIGSNLVLETTRAPDTTTTTSTTTTPAPTTIRRSTTEEPTISPRSQKCVIRMIGKPLFQRYTGTYWGTWMKDPLPREPEDGNKFWFSRHFTGKIISEYGSLDSFQRDVVDRTIELQELYFGTGHVVYNGFLFYHKAGYSQIVKFDLDTQLAEGQAVLPDANFQDKENYVYSTEYNFFDLAADENGLWVIYGSAFSRTSLLVSKINHLTMEIEKTWNISVNHQEYGNGFIACGVLYLVKDTHRKSTFIDFAYDLYEKRTLSVRLKFSNPYQMNNMIAYNPKDKRIYCWDKGNQLYYPLLT